MSISYDWSNQWLYLDWCGDLTLHLVQQSCLLITECFFTQRCTRILNDNTNVTSITSDVGIWLATEFLPNIEAAGVEYMAWVHSSSIDTQACTDVALFDLTTPVVALFNDVASAYSWLRSVKFKAPVFAVATAKKALYQDVFSHNLIPSPVYVR
ncbi:hypothetical protein [Hymenobacter norwichensis]|uniref:hypothetical protein n=1 Tax=Hymenobacter norwichensis TaxID=223903 RepID=UPI0003B4B9E0|nr:hypothetical protein [Hymenobacter norwichensis]